MKPINGFKPVQKTAALLLAAVMIFSVLCLSGCEKSAEPEASPIDAIKTFRDIPGITDEEIAAIEQLQASGKGFTYGMLDSTEAFLSENNERDGFAVLLCELLSSIFEIDFALEVYGWSELISGIESMSIDFTGETTPTEVRQGSKNELFEVDGEMIHGKEYIMSLPIAERMLRIFTQSDTYIMHEYELSELKIGFLEGTTTAKDIRQSYRIDFEEIEVIVPEGEEELDDYDIAVLMLESGEIDVFVEEATADPAFDKYNKDKETIRSTVFFHMIHSPVSLTTVNPAYKHIVSAFDKYMEAGGIEKLYELYTEGDFRYAVHKLYNSFTAEEKAYIADLKSKNEAVGVGYESDNYPLDFYNNKTGMFEGITIDVLAEITKLTGVRFEPAVSKETSWSDIYEMLKAGEIDMVAQLIYSEPRSEFFIWSAVPYASTYYALLSGTEAPFLAIHQVSRSKVGTIKSSGKVDIYHELFPAYNNLTEYETTYECLEALEKGEIDLMMASEYDLLTETHYLEKSSLKINILLDARMESYFGYSKKNNILCSIIDKAQHYVDTGIIETNWTGRQFDYSKKLAEQRVLYTTVFAAFIMLVLIGMVFVLAKNKKLEKKLAEMANNDALTGIYNRRHFMELAETHVAKSVRANIDCFITIFDLDHFKKVNDTYGHLAGDKVLKETAQKVKKTIRPYDILARYGGEEFIILMTDVKELKKEDAVNTMERIRAEICKEPVEFEGQKIAVSASFGVAYAAPKNDISKATELADHALYQAKETGRNKVVFYEKNK